MELLAMAVTVGVFVSIAYILLRSYWKGIDGFNRELFD